MEVVKYFWGLSLIPNYLKKGQNILPNHESPAQTSAEGNSAFNIPAEDHCTPCGGLKMVKPVSGAVAGMFLLSCRLRKGLHRM